MIPISATRGIVIGDNTQVLFLLQILLLHRPTGRFLWNHRLWTWIERDCLISILSCLSTGWCAWKTEWIFILVSFLFHFLNEGLRNSSRTSIPLRWECQSVGVEFYRGWSWFPLTLQADTLTLISVSTFKIPLLLDIERSLNLLTDTIAFGRIFVLTPKSLDITYNPTIPYRIRWKASFHRSLDIKRNMAWEILENWFYLNQFWCSQWAGVLPIYRVRDHPFHWSRSTNSLVLLRRSSRELHTNNFDFSNQLH